MERTGFLRAAIAGWLAVAAAVAAANGYAIRTGRHTMSTGYRNAFTRHPGLIGGATVLLVAHLTGWLPERVDPLRRIR